MNASRETLPCGRRVPRRAREPDNPACQIEGESLLGRGPWSEQERGGQEAECAAIYGHDLIPHIGTIAVVKDSGVITPSHPSSSQVLIFAALSLCSKRLRRPPGPPSRALGSSPGHGSRGPRGPADQQHTRF